MLLQFYKTSRHSFSCLNREPGVDQTNESIILAGSSQRVAPPSLAVGTVKFFFYKDGLCLILFNEYFLFKSKLNYCNLLLHSND